MKAFLFSFCYNVLYTVGWLVTLPSYLLKQKRRGGFGTGLLERFGLYRVSYNREPKGVLYVHAVSVGEVVPQISPGVAPGARRFRGAGHQHGYGA